MITPLRSIFVVSALAISTSFAATIVTPVGATTNIAGDAGSHVDYLLADNPGQAADSLQDGGGSGVLLPTGTDLNVALNTFHFRDGGGHTESWTFGTGGGLPIFTFDLTGNGDTDINSLILWQYGNNGGGINRNGNSTRDFSVIFHTEGEGNAFDFGTETVEFSGTMDSIPDVNTTDNFAQFFDFGGEESARYVALRIDNNYLGQPGIVAGGDRYGLGEVRFSIPEPSSALIAGLGFLTLLRRRR